MDARIVRIWCDTLGVTSAAPGDDFVRAGGHSLLASQFIERLRLDGIDCALQDLVLEPTLAGFSRRVSTRTPRTIVDADANGPFPLIPIQLELLERGLRTGGGSGDAVPLIVRVPKHCDERTLVRAIEAWMRQDLFRLRFFEERGEWRQQYAPIDAPLAIHEETLDDDEEPRVVARVLEVCRKLERRIDITAGPTAAVALLRRDDQPIFMVVLIDHLLVDNFSLEMLLTNFEIAYARLSAGEAIAFPADRTAGLWGAHLARLATRDAVVQELETWTRLFDGGPTDTTSVRRSPSGRPPSPFALEHIVERLDGVAFDRVQPVLRELELSFEDLGLGLLLWAHHECTGETSLLVRMIDNGRDLGGETLDLTRGLGWYSVRYPVRFQLDASGGRDRLLHDIARQRAAIAPRRLHYGLLRYLNPHTRDRLRDAEDWRDSLAFNCLGHLRARETSSSRMFPPADAAAAVVSAFAAGRQDNRRELRVVVSDTHLELRAAFDPATVERAAMRRLVDAVAGAWTGVLHASPASRS
jgi:hypothetical protein